MLRVRGKRVVVEKLGRSKGSVDSLLAMPEDTSAVGIIRHVGEEVKDLQAGQKVYFGKNRHELRMDGSDVLVMDEENVYAIVEEVRAESEKASS